MHTANPNGSQRREIHCFCGKMEGVGRVITTVIHHPNVDFDRHQKITAPTQWKKKNNNQKRRKTMGETQYTYYQDLFAGDEAYSFREGQ
jgi:hypothetical protein